MDDEDEEDGFFVPHGYLSDGEGELDDGDPAGLPKVIILSSLYYYDLLLWYRKAKRKK